MRRPASSKTQRRFAATFLAFAGIALAASAGGDETGGAAADAAAAPGDTWNFQAWYTDSNPGPTWNMTDAVSVTFD